MSCQLYFYRPLTKFGARSWFYNCLSFCSQGRRGVCPIPLDADPTGCRSPSYLDADPIPLDADLLPPGCRPPSPWMQTPQPLDADPPPEADPIRMQTPFPLDADPPGSIPPPPRSRPPPLIRSTSGRYTSYWNAYLYVCVIMGMHKTSGILLLPY